MRPLTLLAPDPDALPAQPDADATRRAERAEWTLRQIRGHLVLLEHLPDMRKADNPVLNETIEAQQSAILAGLRDLVDERPCSHCQAAARVGDATA